MASPDLAPLRYVLQSTWAGKTAVLGQGPSCSLPHSEPLGFRGPCQGEIRVVITFRFALEINYVTVVGYFLLADGTAGERDYFSQVEHTQVLNPAFIKL